MLLNRALLDKDMSRNSFKVIVTEWWILDLDPGVWLCQLHHFPHLLRLFPIFFLSPGRESLVGNYLHSLPMKCICYSDFNFLTSPLESKP